MQSRIAGKADIEKFRQTLNMDLYPVMEDPLPPKPIQLPKQPEPEAPKPKLVVRLPTPTKGTVPNGQVEPAVKPNPPQYKVEPLPPPPKPSLPAENREANRYYRLETKHP